MYSQTKGVYVGVVYHFSVSVIFRVWMTFPSESFMNPRSTNALAIPIYMLRYEPLSSQITGKLVLQGYYTRHIMKYLHIAFLVNFSLDKVLGF